MRIRCLFLLLGLAVPAAAQTDPWTEAQELIRRGDYTRSATILQKLAEKDTSKAVWLQLGSVRQRLGQWSAAKGVYETILQSTPDQPDALNQLALIAEKDFQYVKAFGYYQHLIHLDSTNGFYYRQAGYQTVRMGAREKALPYYQKALQRNPDDQEALAESARILLETGRHKEAIPYIRRGMELDSNSIRMLQLQARLQYRQDAHAGLVETVRRTMALGDTSSYFQRLLGVAYYHIDSLHASVRTFQRLLDLEETETDHAGMATALLLLERKDLPQPGESAFSHWEAAIDIASVRVPDYRMGQVEAMILQPSGIQAAIRTLQDVYTRYKRPKAAYRLGQLLETRDKRMSLVYYQEVLDECRKVKANPAVARPADVSDCSCVPKVLQRVAVLQNGTPAGKEAPTAVAQDTIPIQPDTTRK
ncbi:tetratricopeptide repeat protein [Siphonobacter aquaeclarae]|uniref:Tfp pilus assembly protein PilF n=1 Tax=Siphonobacter aquaeclarae TaxID=563176 RepID=A0A1G9NJY2_9BACT|nr:tetratricopeptide repeat protein [Siphonobacter aquaeclarae]SDL86896.1 Tfp pilus assembly protein PilF [Siphonobacter aquaeclarae]